MVQFRDFRNAKINRIGTIKNEESYSVNIIQCQQLSSISEFEMVRKWCLPQLW